jgi:hypothetical protein
VIEAGDLRRLTDGIHAVVASLDASDTSHDKSDTSLDTPV